MEINNIELMGNLIVKKIRQSNIGDIIIKKGKNLPEMEQRKIGDRMVKLAQKYGIKYMSITTANSLDGNEITLETSLFPVDLYKDSFKALEEVLRRPCQRKGPHDHRGSININRKYSTLELWTPLYKDLTTSDIMATSPRIFSLADSVDCPFDLLDYPLSDNIVDCVDTDESLGWKDPPERREFFLENGRFERNDPIEGHEESIRISNARSQWILFGESAGSINFLSRADSNLFSTGQSALDAIYDNLTLNEHLEILESWFQETSDERIREKLLSSCRNILECFGTTNSYKIIKTQQDNKIINYMVSYNENKESLDFLIDAIKKEHNRHDIPDILGGCCMTCDTITFSNNQILTWDEYNNLCKCRCSVDTHIGQLENINLSLSEAKICEQQGGYIFKLEPMLSPEKISDIIKHICPEKILDDVESLQLIFQS
jgi:hypothetical protein